MPCTIRIWSAEYARMNRCSRRSLSQANPIISLLFSAHNGCGDVLKGGNERGKNSYCQRQIWRMRAVNGNTAHGPRRAEGTTPGGRSEKCRQADC
jgi:hypothetical protein